MKAKFSVDRIEDGKVVLISLTDPTMQAIWPEEATPSKLREGDILSFEIDVDEAGRMEAEERVRRLIDELLNRMPQQ